MDFYLDKPLFRRMGSPFLTLAVAFPLTVSPENGKGKSD